MSEKSEDPQGVRSPPVEVVAVKDHRRVPRYPVTGHEVGECLTVQVVTHSCVVQVGMPVDHDGARDVASFVEKHVLVRFDDDDIWVVEVVCHPVRGNKFFRVGVRLESWGWIIGNRQNLAPLNPSIGDGEHHGSGLRSSQALVATSVGAWHCHQNSTNWSN